MAAWLHAWLPGWLHGWMAAWLHGRMAASLRPDDLFLFCDSSASFCLAFLSSSLLLTMVLLAGWLAGAGWLGLVGWLARCEVLLFEQYLRKVSMMRVVLMSDTASMWPCRSCHHSSSTFPEGTGNGAKPCISITIFKLEF